LGFSVLILCFVLTLVSSYQFSALIVSFDVTRHKFSKFMGWILLIWIDIAE